MANFKIQNVRIQLKHDTAANWASSSLIPLEGELCLDTTNKVIKIGDGTNPFNNLPTSGCIIAEASAYDETNNPGGIDAEHGGIKVNGKDINVYTLTPAATNALGGIKSAGDPDDVAEGSRELGKIYVDATTGQAVISYVKYADQLKTAHTISFEESTTDAGDTDVTGTFTFDGSGNVATQLKLVNKFDTDSAASKRVVVANVDAKGRVISDEYLLSSDIHDAVNAGAADNADATAKAVVAGKAILADADGKLDNSFLHTTGVVANDGVSDAAYTAVKVDSKGRVVEGLSTSNNIASNKNGANAAVLGFVKSDFDGALADDADDNKGKIKISAAGEMSVARVNKADQLTAARTVSFADSGDDTTDATGSFSFDGSGNVTTQLELIDKITLTGADATKGYKRFVTTNVDAKGRVVGEGSALVSADISNAVAATTGANEAARVIKTDTNGKLDDSFLNAVDYTQAAADNTATTVITNITRDTKGRITGTSKMEATATGGTSADGNKLVKLTADGKLDNSIIPALAIGEVQTVTYADNETVGENSVVAFKGITAAQSGDVAVVTTTKGASETAAAYAARSVTNGDGVYIYAGNESGTEAYSASNWILIKAPGSAIQSVNGKTGPTVVLETGDIAEGGTATTDVSYIQASGTYQSGTTYYEDAAGTIEADISTFDSNTPVDNLFVAQSVSAAHRYFTEARAYSAIHAVKTRDTANSFRDAAHIMMDTDTYIMNCGSARTNTHNF